jgi:hypothetical protein
MKRVAPEPRLIVASTSTLIIACAMIVGLAGCLEAPFAPAPTSGGRCAASGQSSFGCGDDCAQKQVEASAVCTSTLEGQFDAGDRLCRFADGTVADFGATLPSPSELAEGREPFSLTISRGSTPCLALRVDAAPAFDLDPPRETELLIGEQGCFRQRATYAVASSGGFELDAIELLCDGRLRSARRPELCADCPMQDCRELALLRVELAENAGLVELRLVAGARVTPLLSCRRAP